MSPSATPDLTPIARWATAGLFATGFLSLFIGLISPFLEPIKGSMGTLMLAAAVSFGVLLHTVARR